MISKILIWLICALNLYLGSRAFLNVIHVLDTSKYAPSTTALFAVVFLGLGAAGFYFTLFRQNLKLAWLIAFGPWLLALLVLFVTAATSSHQ